MKFNPEKHHRHSTRLRGYDYARDGAYFVTLCEDNRDCLFGDVIDGKMRLNDFGQIVADCWKWLGNQYPYIELDEWVVMPNHLHGIIVLRSDRGAFFDRGASRRAPTDIIPKIKPLGQLIGAFKIVSTPHINAVRNRPGARVWQRNYHDHVIRNDEELDRIRNYIINNPQQWERDRNNPLSARYRPASQ